MTGVDMENRIFNIVREILSEHFCLSRDSIELDSDLTKDLGADSLDKIELIMALEDEFEVEILNSDMDGCKTVKDVVNALQR